MDITFQEVKKETAMRYLIAGSSDVSNNNCVFSGTLDIEDVREQNEYEYGVDDLMKGQIRKEGLCIARYNLKVEGKQEDCGTFSGISVFRWYIDDNDELRYDDINESSDSYSNNLFAGIWQSNTGDRMVKCAWGQYRIPDCGDLDIGAAEFSVNPAYAANGWEDPDVLNECKSLSRQQVDSVYKIISKESGHYYCLSINGKEFQLKEMLDYGDLDLNVYEKEDATIVLIGLTDVYESIYFVYSFKDGTLMRLGEVKVVQPEGVEVNGSKKIMLKVYAGNGKILVKSYLDDSLAGENEFLGLSSNICNISVPNDLDSMELLRTSILKLEKSVFQEKVPVMVYDSAFVNGFFVGQGIDSSVRLYKSLPDKGAIKVILFAYLRECHNDSYPALELQTFDSENRFIDRLLVSASIFEEGGLYRHSAVDKDYRVKVTDVIVDYDLENDADQEKVTEQSYNYVIDSNGFFKPQ